jgi:hypothetical protein
MGARGVPLIQDTLRNGSVTIPIRCEGIGESLIKAARPKSVR